MRRVLLTGAGGGVATMIRPLLSQRFEEIILSDIKPVDNLLANERFEHTPLTDYAAVYSLLDGVNGIIHLGGFSVEGPWQEIHEANITGLYNIFEAARNRGVERFVFASSNHTIGFYTRQDRIGTDHRVRPDGYYGVSKVFGEAMASLYADKFNLRTLSIRIGNVADKPIDGRRLAIWIHPEDLMQLIEIGLTHPDLHNEIVYGVSDNDRSWWDNHKAYALGYNPKHQSEDHVEHALAEQAKLADDSVGDQFQGGSFCSIDFAGNLNRLKV